MDVARTNMLKFFKIRFRTGSKVTQFFAGFNSLTPINYIWFFEFSIPYLLVKLRYAESMTQGILYAHSNVV